MVRGVKPKKPFNYRWWRSRYVVKVVLKQPERPWVTVSQAARILGKSKPAISMKYLIGEMDSISFAGVIYVKINSKNNPFKHPRNRCGRFREF